MSGIKDYEKKVLHLLASDALSPEQLSAVADEGEVAGYEQTEGGYFLSIRHESLPAERIVCSSPIVNGSAGGVTCGFVVFIEGGLLTLECHSWGDPEIPEGFREMDVRINAS